MDKTSTAILATVIAIIISIVFSLPVYFLWNECLVDAIDGVNRITWIQAYGITILFNILIKTNFETRNNNG